MFSDNNEGDESRFNYYIIIFFISIFIQNVDILSLGSSSIKLFHMFVIFSFFFIGMEFKFNKALIPVSMFFLLLIFTSLFIAIEYGLSSLILNYAFVLFMSIAIAKSSIRITYKEFIYNLKLVAIPAYAFIFLNLLINYSSVLEAQQMSVVSGARPEIPFMLFSGGMNVEASYLAMISVLFIRTRLFFPFVLISTFVSMGYMSRTGFILNVIAASFWFYLSVKDRLSKLALYFYMPILATFFLLSLAILAYYSDIYVVKRFLEIGNEPGSQGRLDIIEFIIPGLIDSNFLGYGPGNTMENLKLLGLSSHNDNVHNYFLQVLLDFGILGFLLYIAFILSFLLKNNVLPEFKFFFLMYLISSLVQFRGAEPLIWGVVFMGLLVGRSELKSNIERNY